MAKDKTTAVQADAAAKAAPDAKGRPTPKRAEKEAQNRRPLVLDPKASSKQRRERDREQRIKEDYALRTGDERNMPPMHRGADRRYIRDFIDARTSIGELLVPVTLVLMVVGIVFGQNQTLSGAVLIAVYALVLIALADTFLTLRKMKMLLENKFGADRIQRGWRMYAASRMLNMRRLRTPKPKVKRREFPQ